VPAGLGTWGKEHGIAKATVERHWEEAKRAVKKQYPKIAPDSDRFYQLVMGIVKKMSGVEESAMKIMPSYRPMPMSGMLTEGSESEEDWPGQMRVAARLQKVGEYLGMHWHSSPGNYHAVGKDLKGRAIMGMSRVPSDDVDDIVELLGDMRDEEKVKAQVLIWRDRFPEAFKYAQEQLSGGQGKMESSEGRERSPKYQPGQKVKITHPTSAMEKDSKKKYLGMVYTVKQQHEDGDVTVTDDHGSDWRFLAGSLGAVSESSKDPMVDRLMDAFRPGATSATQASDETSRAMMVLQGKSQEMSQEEAEKILGKYYSPARIARMKSSS